MGRLEGPLAVLQANGRYGVSLFFAVSGFLICSLLLREERRNGAINLRAFYIRRSLRLFPLYYSVLLLYNVLIYFLNQFSPENQILFWEKLPFHLTYLSNYTAQSTQGPFFFSWSLAIEEQFYLVFSVLFFFLARRHLIQVIVAALIAKFLILNYIVAFDGAHDEARRLLSSFCEPILMGVLAAVAIHTKTGFRMLHVLSKPWLLMLVGVSVVILLACYEIRGTSEPVAQMLYLLMTALIEGVAMRPRVPMLGNRLLLHIGKVSYGIYLLHMLFIMATERLITANPVIVFPLATIGVVIGASVVFQYFEQPLLRYKKRFSRA